MAWNGFDLASPGIGPKRVRMAFAFEIATISSKVSEESLPFHPTVTTS